MDVENYRRFLEAIGHRIIVSRSGYWFNISRWFYESIPPFRVIAPDQAEINMLLRKYHVIGLKYCTNQNNGGKPSAIYLCQGKEYDLKNLHPKMRNKVRQGLRNCSVQPITFDYLHDHGVQLNQDTLIRQRRDDPILCQPDRWASLCQAGEEIEGAETWGAFVNGQLAAYMITFIIDGYSNILYQMSKTDFLASRANNALTFVATQAILNYPGIQGVSYGHASIRELPGLEEFKTRLGYKKWSVNYMVVLHPLVRFMLMNRIGDTMLTGMTRLLRDDDVLRRITGIVDIAKYSQIPSFGSEPG